MHQGSILTWLNKPNAGAQHRGRETLSNGSQVKKDQDQKVDFELANKQSRHGLEDAKATASTKDSKLPPNVEFKSCTKEHIPRLKRLNSLLLPTTYPESFYREITHDVTTNNVTVLAFWHNDPPDSRAQDSEEGTLIGAVSCRLLDPQSTSKLGFPARSSNYSMLYLSTLAVLSPYRGHGIANALVKEVVRRAVCEHGVVSVGAHVWESNEDALEWYFKRGFVEVARQDVYYRKLTPSGAIVIKKDLHIEDIFERNQQASNSG